MQTSLRPVGIWGVGSYVPERVLTNAHLEQMVDTSDEWIVARTGIRERRIAAPDETTASMSARAAAKALERAGVTADEIDLIVVGTVTPDMLFPSTACLVQERIGAAKAAAVDVGAACPGFIYALTLAQSTVATGMYEKVLVIGSETLSRVTDYQDRNTCVLFGDGAGAAVIGPVSPGRGILSAVLGSDPSGRDHLYLPGGGSLRPATHETVDQRLHYLRMNGPEVFKFAARVVADSTRKALKKAGLGLDDVDLFIPHQANVRIIEAGVKRLEIPSQKVWINLDRYGNTSSATIPLCLDEAFEQGRIADGDVLAMVAFGAGLVWGAVILRWGI